MSGSGGETTDMWIVIPNWDTFQHYKKRGPTWIKNYTDLLHKDEYLELSANARSLLHGLWIIYAKTNGEVSVNTANLSRKLNLRVTKRQLESLNHAGFIEFSASKPLAQRQRQRHTPISPNNNGPQKAPTPKGGPCPDCGETIGKGHLETCPRMPRTVDTPEVHLELVHGTGAA